MYFWLLIILVLVVDQASKYIIQQVLPLWESFPVVSGVLYITHVHNSGAAFGILANRTGLLIVVTLVVIVAVLYFYRQIIGLGRIFQLALAFELGGALGNLVDRVRLGYVVDFIDFRFWPVFNFADIAIVVGIAIIGYKVFWMPNQKIEN